MTPVDLREHEREWNDIAALDPHWAVLSEPERKHGRWDDDAFFATGEREVAERMERAATLGRPGGRGAALDFGCGLGRCTRALASRFDRAVGVDVSGEMIERARALNAGVPDLELELNLRDDLAVFADLEFDLTLSNLVLQHLPSRRLVEAYLVELIRVTRGDGLLVFQLPSSAPLAVRLQPRRRLYRVLRGIGLSTAFLYGRLGLHPMSMLAVPRAEVTALLERAGAAVVHVDSRVDPTFGFESLTYYVAPRA